ncbi:MAG: cell division protein SepF [Selenomonadaceae bacterium]|nr:cell division protein SepF [Selenomonadaceae bacterium]
MTNEKKLIVGGDARLDTERIEKNLPRNVMIVSDWIKKITDILMPIEEPNDEEYVETKKVEAKANESKVQPEIKEVKRAAAGGGGYAKVTTAENGTMSVGGKRYVAYETPAVPKTDSDDQPSLKVVRSPEFSVKIYHSINGSQVCAVADDILSRKAAVVNYEQLDEAEQRRICDFINGVCYASDGSVRMISDKIFLYAPSGINSEDIAMAASSVYAGGQR